MSNFVRRIVSGNKARFKDANLDIELDLVYVTDHVLIMGFPATGVEGFYRNHRDDTKKFLEFRHAQNYWVFNFCPLRENSYPATFFNDRVSRYPFPDHHAPPLSILPLVVRELREWLSGSSDRVAVLHCKAGKGRSGTVACAYLLSLDETPSAPKLQRSMPMKEWARQRADQIMETVQTEDMDTEATEIENTRVAEEKGPPTAISAHLDSRHVSSDHPRATLCTSEETIKHGDASASTPVPGALTGEPTTETPPSITPTDTPATELQRLKPKKELKGTTLEDVLALHSSRRMKAPSSPSKKMKQGVSIPSQRRWLYYWSLILAHEAPRDFWSSPRAAPRHKVRLLSITVRMRELGGVKMGLLKLANTLIERANAAKYSAQERGKGLVWVSLARYNDAFVEMLEKWEKHTRDEDGDMGRRKEGSGRMTGEDALQDMFKDGKWDKGKMIRSFARLGDVDGTPEKGFHEDGRITTHRLKPLSERKWEAIQEQISDLNTSEQSVNPNLSVNAAPSTASSVTDLGQDIDDKGEDEGVILDAEREVRAKLYLGQVFLGWFWFIPTFHMPQPPFTKASEKGKQTPTHFVLMRKDLDFPIGAGSAIIDVDVAMEWVIPAAEPVAAAREPPKTQTSEDSKKGIGGEPESGPIVAGVQAAIADASGREAVEAVQATDQ